MTRTLKADGQQTWTVMRPLPRALRAKAAVAPSRGVLLRLVGPQLNARPFSQTANESTAGTKPRQITNASRIAWCCLKHLARVLPCVQTVFHAAGATSRNRRRPHDRHHPCRNTRRNEWTEGKEQDLRPVQG